MLSLTSTPPVLTADTLVMRSTAEVVAPPTVTKVSLNRPLTASPSARTIFHAPLSDVIQVTQEKFKTEPPGAVPHPPVPTNPTAAADAWCGIANSERASATPLSKYFDTFRLNLIHASECENFNT